jgi:hypothetical protein
MVKKNEFELAQNKINELLNSSGTTRVNGPLREFLKIVDNFVQLGENSKYFRRVSPFDVQISTSSQCRAVTQVPKQVNALKDSILRNGVTHPLLTVKNSTAAGAELLNGVHRDAAAKGLLDSKQLDSNWKYPCVEIPSNMRALIQPAFGLIQLILNEDEGKKLGNNKNDYAKTLDAYIKDHNVDLEDEEGYQEMHTLLMNMDKHRSSQGAKSLLTRRKNAQKVARSDVEEHNTDAWRDHAAQAFKLSENGTRGVKTRYQGKILNSKFDGAVDLVAPGVGSSFDQRFLRDHRWKKAYPRHDLALAVIAQNTEGDPKSVIQKRIKFFTDVAEIWRDFGPSGLHFDYILIAPQIRQSVQTTYGDPNNPSQIRHASVRAEHVTVVGDWTVITKAALISEFNNGVFFKKSWCFTEVKQVVPKLVITAVA